MDLCNVVVVKWLIITSSIYCKSTLSIYFGLLSFGLVGKAEYEGPIEGIVGNGVYLGNQFSVIDSKVKTLHFWVMV